VWHCPQTVSVALAANISLVVRNTCFCVWHCPQTVQVALVTNIVFCVKHLFRAPTLTTNTDGISLTIAELGIKRSCKLSPTSWAACLARLLSLLPLKFNSSD